MAIKGSIVKSGASGMTVTGGTDKTFTDDGQVVTRGIHVHDAAQADFRYRDNAIFQNKQPSVNPDGTYGKARRSVAIYLPRALASGKTTVNLVRIEVEVHPEMSAAVELEARLLAAQLLTDADYTSFWTAGSLS